VFSTCQPWRAVSAMPRPRVVVVAAAHEALPALSPNVIRRSPAGSDRGVVGVARLPLYFAANAWMSASRLSLAGCDESQLDRVGAGLPSALAVSIANCSWLFSAWMTSTMFFGS
jgi:hypothetical protein